MTAVRDVNYFKKWYQANAAKLNERRRKKYATDPEVRKRALEYQVSYRARVERASTKGRPQYRPVGEHTVQVFRIASAAAMIGCSVEFIRKYENAGIIPKPTVASPQRYYTQEQINLMKDFYEIRSSLKFSRNAELKAITLEKQASIMNSKWNDVVTN